MPSRRRLAEIANLILRHNYAMQEQENQANLQRESQRQAEGINTAQQILGRGLADPQFGMRLSRMRDVERVLPPGLSPSILQRSGAELTGDISKEISQAKDFDQLPSELDIANRATAAGVEEPLQLSKQLNRATEPGELPSSNFNLQSGPTIQSLTNQRNQRRDVINTAQELQMDRKLAEAKGTAYNTKAGEEQAAEEFFGKQQDRAQLARQAEQADKLRYEQQLNSIMASRAGAEQLARNSPENIAAEVDKFEQMEAIRAQYRVPTDAASRASGLYIPLVRSDVGATALEKQGTFLGLGTQTLGNQPFFNKMIANEQRQYLQHAQNFINIASLVLTGVTARPDEYQRYTSTLFALTGDDQATLAQKQKARQDFMASVKARAERGQGGSLEEIMQQLGLGGTDQPQSREDMINQLNNARRAANGR